MYFFYIDESGSRDPSVGTAEKPKDHIYVLLAVGLFERQWRPLDRSIKRAERTRLSFGTVSGTIYLTGLDRLRYNPGADPSS